MIIRINELRYYTGQKPRCGIGSGAFLSVNAACSEDDNEIYIKKAFSSQLIAVSFIFKTGTALISNNIPDHKTCLELMERYQMLSNIREHCILVSRVALALAAELNKNGEALNLLEIEAAALLHDITKTKSIHSRENHAETGAHLLSSLGYERIAQIVNAHISITDMDAGGRITEEEIVNYADKRVLHSTVVSLDQRFEDLMQRYGRNQESQHYIMLQKTRTRALEDKIFSRIHRPPADLPALIAQHPY